MTIKYNIAMLLQQNLKFIRNYNANGYSYCYITFNWRDTFKEKNGFLF